MTTIGSYQVHVTIESVGQQLALLSPAKKQDMPTNWTFNWRVLWENTDFECQNKPVWRVIFWGSPIRMNPPPMLEQGRARSSSIVQSKSRRAITPKAYRPL